LSLTPGLSTAPPRDATAEIWKYLYRAVDRDGDTVDFLLRAKRDYAAARRFLERAIELHGVPEKITINKSGANTAAIEGMRADSGADIELRQSKYLNNIVEQDHRVIKRIVRPMLGFKSFRCARIPVRLQERTRLGGSHEAFAGTHPNAGHSGRQIGVAVAARPHSGILPSALKASLS
jgi:hypothetical protein